mmetsp:Transcript_27424/g.49805  ORF Transcript_27424/g.49805 Transcript_27424/m.49805 type:complete len:83 (-) Transcript_27424:664-912(-)
MQSMKFRHLFGPRRHYAFQSGGVCTAEFCLDSICGPPQSPNTIIMEDKIGKIMLEHLSRNHSVSVLEASNCAILCACFPIFK